MHSGATHSQPSTQVEPARAGRFRGVLPHVQSPSLPPVLKMVGFELRLSSPPLGGGVQEGYIKALNLAIAAREDGAALASHSRCSADKREAP